MCSQTKDALERRINELEAELKNQKDDNSQLLNNICSTADDMAKIKEVWLDYCTICKKIELIWFYTFQECKELEDRLKEKLAFSVSGVPAISMCICFIDTMYIFKSIYQLIRYISSFVNLKKNCFIVDIIFRTNMVGC